MTLVIQIAPSLSACWYRYTNLHELYHGSITVLNNSAALKHVEGTEQR